MKGKAVMPSGYVNIYECPHGCKAQGKPIAASVRGWKKHMTRNHSGYTDEQLAAIVGAAPPDRQRGREAFLFEAGKVPGQDESAIGEKTDAEGTGSPDPEQAAAAPVSKVVPLKMRKLKKAMASLPLVFLKAKGIEVDDDDREIIDGAQEILEDMFGVSIEVPESAWVIRSRLIALLFPLGAILLVWAKHALPAELMKRMEAAKESEKVAAD